MFKSSSCSHFTSNFSITRLCLKFFDTLVLYLVAPDIICSDSSCLSNVQAPVSDREYKATLPETASMIDLASTMINEGRGSELMPREANPDSPITAYRWVALLCVCFNTHIENSDLTICVWSVDFILSVHTTEMMTCSAPTLMKTSWSRNLATCPTRLLW